MQAERDHLRTHVFPALEEKARERRRFIEWVDLRLGATASGDMDEGAYEFNVLTVCLDQVRRCRPFLIVLLGDRYGWIPPSDLIGPAAAEAGFNGEVAGRSLTDLEIDLGVFSDSEQISRSFFYFREPLPFRQMSPELAARYSDDYASDPAATERASRLAGLKQRIETKLPNRVRRYAAHWDGRRVTALDAFGQMVLEDIWADLADETAHALSVGEISWQQAEHNALEDFVDDRAHDFVGREPTMARVKSLCFSPTHAGAPWGICVTGDSGSGKSALFGALYLDLKNTGAFILAHAAGASTQAASVGSMLLRWTEEIAAELGVASPLPEKADREALEAAFLLLLAQMASQRRTIVLVDALDQFNATARERSLLWLSRSWPQNARFVATATPGDAVDAIADHRNIELLPLPALNASEAERITTKICERYHRTLHPTVIDALLAKTGAKGPAWNNPLWLVLAVEEINLIGADDFDRAQRSYAGPISERLRCLVLDIVAGLPTDVPGLYTSTFDRAAKLFGHPLTTAFVGLIGVSRGGWRELDFRSLLPMVTGEPWDELRFVTLRRLFRGQMGCDVLGRWDFTHLQMQEAMREHFLGLRVSLPHFHRCIADHLLTLPAGDPLHLTETIGHLLANKDWARAARYYGDVSLTIAEREGATRVFAELVSGPGGKTETLKYICPLLDASGLDDSVIALVAQRLIVDLIDAVEYRADFECRITFLRSAQQALERLLSVRVNNAMWQRDLSLACRRIGRLLQSQKRLDEALKSCRQSVTIMEGLAAADTSNRSWQYDLWDSYDSLGGVLSAQGKLEEALKFHRDGLSILERLDAADHGNRLYQIHRSVSYDRLGGVLRAQGKLEEALKFYRDGLSIRERLATADPSNTRRQYELSISCTQIGRLLVDQGELEEALKAFNRSLIINERLVSVEPKNYNWQRELALGRLGIAFVYEQQGRIADLVREAVQAREIIANLLAIAPHMSGLTDILATVHEQIARLRH